MLVVIGGCHGAREFLPESEEEAEDNKETQVRNGWAVHDASRRLRGASVAELLLLSPVCFLDLRWRRLATDTESVLNRERDGCSGRLAFLLESHYEVDEDEDDA
ncbi:hypothetical protein E2562_006724 [Oryza meyeriana var. granulata]|uniref:Uncharacterized protein n=1 Tax=Oryza meyeriana var. granulata TaxID=110450 RepID=A0A6G1EGP2_9ORYZ|nr:hypothetical protein E2562_006724 [Oryza meyeriana var. granulata]